ncbi:nuclear transport factor 2 family protein [Variovorax terrae]|uniref:Nuclear transport factor 2 family protein n=1 Tax=Variovorax terrae TaxID=2923278 RepID=A0A9X2AQH5_9BURK|nr:nuclear transport factor 2 family protein [Variovorax terrae]MCJ0766010.1 nuclear transport factor 2 family protein [Variovorax terrae]
MSTTARTPHQIIADHYAASDRHDLDGMLADMAPDVRWTEMAGFPCAGTYVGAQAVVEHVFQRLAADWQDYRFTLERLYDAGATVLATGQYSGTHRASGRSFTARVAHVWQLHGGRVTAFEQFTDTLLVAQAVA